MFDFPNSPTTNQQATGSGGQVYTFDGTKWVATATLPGVTAWNTRTGNVTMTSGDVTTALSYTPYDAANPSGYQTAAQVTAAVAPALNDTGRNLVHNPVYTVQQRGTGAWTTNLTYTADRWMMNFNTDTSSVSLVALADADRAAIGDEAAYTTLQDTFTGTSGATSQTSVMQRVEDVRRLSNKTVTVSFWGRTTSGTLKVGMGYGQLFGTGGSPSSSPPPANIGQATLTTTWTRVSATGSLPSIAGKALGTNNDHSTAFYFFMSCSPSNANSAAAGNIGVQSGTVQMWGVQLEYGSVATPLDKGGSPQMQLAECQRFYQVYTSVMSYAVSTTASAAWVFDFPLAVPLRAGPTVTFANQTYSNTSGLAGNNYLASHLRFIYTITSANIVSSTQFDFTASADL